MATEHERGDVLGGGVRASSDGDRPGIGPGAAEHCLHPDRRPALRRGFRARTPVPRDTAPRSADRTRRAVRERLRDHLALLAESRVDSHRAVCPPARRAGQSHPPRPTDADLPAGTPGRRLPDRVRRQVAHGRNLRRAPARVRPLGVVSGPGSLLQPDLQHRRRTGAAPGVHDGPDHRLRAGLPGCSPRGGRALPALRIAQGGTRFVPGRGTPRRKLRRQALSTSADDGEPARQLRREAELGRSAASKLARRGRPLRQHGRLSAVRR